MGTTERWRGTPKQATLGNPHTPLGMEGPREKIVFPELRGR